jgi:hypothetical protein
MIKRSFNNIRNRLTLVTAVVLTVFAGLLALSALMAQAPPPKHERPHCDWPPADAQQADQVKKAFESLLDESVTNTALRDNLLNCNQKNCEKPTKAVKTRLDAMFPGNKIKIPNDLVIVFWEQEPGKGKVQNMSWDYRENHCYSILYLPDAGSASVTKADFKEHLLCCYKPW